MKSSAEITSLTTAILLTSLLIKNVHSSQSQRNITAVEGEHRNPYLLNLTVIPLHYTLRMRPVLHDGYPGLVRFTAPSSVTILVESVTKKSENVITMHQRNLNIDVGNVTVSHHKDGRPLGISSHSFEPARDLYTIKLRDAFEFGDKLEIYIPYTVDISQTENVGIYLGHYVDAETKEKRFLSATKLEPYHARKVFPLFDEPSLKAKWSVVVGRLDDGKYHSLSNMEIERVEDDLEYKGWVWDHYYESVLMPPYLVCIIVSDFINETANAPGSTTKVTTWAPKHYINRGGGNYGVYTALSILSFFERKFKIKYPLNKLDAVALPQFPTGATENFGVVTYRHRNLIWVPGENTESQRRKVTQVLGHEIAHQWYGNMVTCAWWSDIWLNEGFARYLQYWAMAETIPEHKPVEAFVNDITQTAMILDQSVATHPLRNSAKSPSESAAVFDKITYEKGACMLRMLEGFMTRDLFESGLIDVYLHRMKWKSATQEDFFDAMQDAIVAHDAMYLLPSGATVKDIMTPWTLQTGYPLITVKVIDKSTISISQQKFSTGSAKNSSVKWWIPISIITESKEKNGVPLSVSTFWLPNNISNVKFSSPLLDTEARWLMLNPNATGYYRVLYDERLTELIGNQLVLNHTVISSSSRSQLFDDYFQSALAGYTGIRPALELTTYLGREVESNVWKSLLRHLQSLRFRFKEDQEAQELFKNHFLPRVEDALGLIGERQVRNELGINVTLRAHLYDFICPMESRICLEYAEGLLTEWERKPRKNPFPLDLRSSLYCPAVASATMKASSTAWSFMMGKYLESHQDSAERPVLVKALTCSKNLTDLESLLEMAITSNSSKYFNPHRRYILETLILNPVARPLVFQFVKKALVARKISPETFNNVVRFISMMPNRPDGFTEEVEKFIENYQAALESDKSMDKNEVTMAVMYVKQSLKQVKEPYRSCRRCGGWWETVGKDAVSWLKAKQAARQQTGNGSKNSKELKLQLPI